MATPQAQSIAAALTDLAVDVDQLANEERANNETGVAAFYATMARGLRDAARDMVNPPVVVTPTELGIDTTPSDE